MHCAKVLIHNLHYTLSNGRPIFQDLNIDFSSKKISLIGQNGIGKSTLLKLISGQLAPTMGNIHVHGTTYYCHQDNIFSEVDTIASFLGMDEKLQALKRLQLGSIDEQDFEILNDEWDMETKIKDKLSVFQLNPEDLFQKISTLSGGEKQRLQLLKCFSQVADFLLLDEPSNNLDSSGREALYSNIQNHDKGLLIATHDRTLLGLMDEIIELTTARVQRYGGNYQAYLSQKSIEMLAKQQALNTASKQLSTLKTTIQASHEKHQRSAIYGKKNRKASSQPKMVLDARKDRSQQTQKTLSIRHERLLKAAIEKQQAIKKQLAVQENMHFELKGTQVPSGKVLVEVENLSFQYPHQASCIIQDFNFTIQGAERIALLGHNGSGKSTFIQLLLNQLMPLQGKIKVNIPMIHYLDQSVDILDPNSSIIDNYMTINDGTSYQQAHEALAKFLFKNADAHQRVCDLSGGEKLRAALPCILFGKTPPQLLILDEPTNHLDIDSLTAVENALNQYKGGLIVVSHDQSFLNNIHTTRTIYAPFIQ